MTANERKEIIKSIETQLNYGYIDLGCYDKDELKILKQAMSALNALEQFRWERDIAIEQLNELGLNLGQKVDHVKEAIEKSNIQNAIYKDGIFVCPNCEASIFPLSLYGGDYCIKCGQHVRWRGIIK